MGLHGDEAHHLSVELGHQDLGVRVTDACQGALNPADHRFVNRFRVTPWSHPNDEAVRQGEDRRSIRYGGRSDDDAHASTIAPHRQTAACWS
jgi:hypothetical protein